MITSLSEIYFRSRRFILLVQTKKVISMNYGSSTRSWKPWRWVRLNLILLMRDIYINSNLNPLTKFTISRRSTELKDILPWNISQMITKTMQISTRIAINNAMKQGIHCEYDGKSMETETTPWSELPKGGKAIVEHILVFEERKISKRARLRITVWDMSRKVNHLSKVIWDYYDIWKIMTEFTRSISSTRIGKPVLMMHVKVSKDKHICRWVDQENLVCVRWSRMKNRAQRRRRWLIQEKEVRHWVK